MNIYQKQILQAQQEITKLKGNQFDKRDILSQTLQYFDQQQDNSSDDLRYVLSSVRDSIDNRLIELQSLIEEKRAQMSTLFDDMKEVGYRLRASFHHDGKSGTGHYWAYIWVEPSEESLLEDIPSEGGWFKFCDASVTAATAEDILNDPVPPFSFMYVSDALPKFSKEQLFDCIPDTLKEFINSDNELFAKEIHARDHPMEDTALISTATTSDDDIGFTEKMSTDSAHLVDSSTTFPDDSSAGTAVNQGQTEEMDGSEMHVSSFYDSSARRKEHVNSKIIEVSNYPSDDYRLLKSFETFLARAQNPLNLEHLYLFYSSENEDGSIVVDEEASKQDVELKPIWKEYIAYLKIGEMVTEALSYFVKQEFSRAIQGLLDTKRSEATWKTQIMLDTDVSIAYTGLETLSFYPIILKYGKKCLQILNENAFKKALNAAYTNRGLEEAIRIAYQAQTIIGPDNISEDSLYQSLGQLWFSLTEKRTDLTESQGDLLNTLIMVHLEGQSNGIHTGSRSDSPTPEQEEDEDDIIVWQKYRQLCIESDMLLDSLSSE
ncbi:MAG: hypothetical protein EXX96DRAFT_594419 [Benjaminiella poitrasii]|nr:MAG: hypothetical protein EXX96DRAFT_594419 [Benjaminiella poitrasii]